MEAYCPHCGTVHRPGLAPMLCEQARRGAMALYGRILTREEAVENPEKEERPITATEIVRRSASRKPIGDKMLEPMIERELAMIERPVENPGQKETWKSSLAISFGEDGVPRRDDGSVYIPVEKSGKTGGLSKKEKMEASVLADRLAATEKRLAVLREKERAKKAKWRKKDKGSKSV